MNQNTLYKQVHDLSCEYLVLEQEIITLQNIGSKAAEGRLHGEMVLQLTDESKGTEEKKRSLNEALSAGFSPLVFMGKADWFQMPEQQTGETVVIPQPKKKKCHYSFTEKLTDTNTLLIVNLLITLRVTRQKEIALALAQIGVPHKVENE